VIGQRRITKGVLLLQRPIILKIQPLRAYMTGPTGVGDSIGFGVTLGRYASFKVARLADTANGFD
jgi:hypothetical protein